MKTLLLIGAAAAIAAAPSATQTKQVPPAPWTTGASSAPVAPAPSAPAPAPDRNAAPVPAEMQSLAKLGGTDAASSSGDESWSKLEDNTRYLLIMGSADGFAASGAGAPCFPGDDNSSLDAKLKSSGFADGNPVAVAGALTKLSGDREKCSTVPRRGYTNQLLKGMPDAHLALYLSGAVRAYATVRKCPAENHAYAAAAASAAIFSGSDDAQPAEILSSALAEGCRGKPAQ